MAVAQGQAVRSKKATKSRKKLRLPQQFKPGREINKGPFGPWVESVLKQSPELTMERLTPQRKDLELVSRLAYQRDELGDNLAKLLLKDRQVGRQFEHGLAHGIDSLDNPPQALVDFLNYYENIPDWAYMPELKSFLADSKNPERSAAREALPGFALDGLAMATGFFIGANYPAVGQSLVATGSVAAGTGRMTQTMNYVEDMVDIRGFLPFGQAIQSNAKVRLAHAFARKQIERSGVWDVDYYGEIISDFDNMIFMSGLTLVGDLPAYSRLSPRSKQAMRLQTKGMQYLLGAPKELVTMSIEENQRFFVMVIAHLDDSPATARQVVEAFRKNDYFRPTETWQGKISKELAFLTANMITRIGWGNVMANNIGLEKRFMGVDLSSLADFVREPPEILHMLQPHAANAVDQLEKWSKALPRPKKATSSKKRSTAAPYRGSYGFFKGAEAA